MKWIKYTSRQETYANILLWSVMLIVPLVGMVVLSSVDNNHEFHWRDVWHLLRPLLVILLAFLIHNYFIAPELVYKQHRGRYLVMLSVLLVCFIAYQCTTGPPGKPGMQIPTEHIATQDHLGGPVAPRPDRPRPQGLGTMHNRGSKPLAGPHDFTMFALLVFSLGANLGIKLYFKTQHDHSHLAELEKENLRQELTYLRYQVNPHFLMNTLNNIHALVDIDPCEAKASIVHLSKFMRYLLYESEAEYISLQQAVDLIHQYISLMSKRYAQKVDISFIEPDHVPNVGIAPLIVMPFIENAFKHGVSYDKPSFIHMWLKVEEGNVCFGCVNSKNGVKHEYGGVGLANVRKRLELIYGERYSLNIDDAENYSVTLIVPAEPISMATGESHNLTKTIK